MAPSYREIAANAGEIRIRKFGDSGEERPWVVKRLNRRFWSKKSVEDWISVESEQLPFQILLRLGENEGRLVCTGIHAEVSEREVHARDLRRIPLGEILSEIGESRDVFVAVAGSVDLEQRIRTRPGPRGHTDDYYKTIAEDYRRVLKTAPRAPIKRLAKERHLSESTTRRHIQRARDKGFLESSIPGRAGEKRGKK